MSTNKFILDGRYGDLLQYYGINVEEALKKQNYQKILLRIKHLF